jgi:hypothetical protein
MTNVGTVIFCKSSVKIAPGRLIGRRLDHQRRNRADERCLRHAIRAMPRDVADYFAAAGRVTDMHGILEVQVRGQRRQVIGIVIHIVTVCRLARASMAAAVMGDDPIAAIQEENELRIQSSEESGQPCESTIGVPLPQSL